MKHLLFQVAAPIAAFGNEAARSERPSDDHPRKAAMIGLVGAAMGLERNDPWFSQADQALGFAVVTLRSGHRLNDYHIVTTPEGSKVHQSRRLELEASDYTVETVRGYLSDVYFIVCFWQDPKGPGAELERIALCLEEPQFELFVGRKSCPLGLPPSPMITDVGTLEDAFLCYQGCLFEPIFSDENRFRVYWEDHPSTQLKAIHSASRNDRLVDLEKKLYRSRIEHEGMIEF